jgi:hypothetical protein
VIRYTIDGSDPTPVNGSDYLGAFDIFTTTTVKFRAYDNLGNEEAVGSQLIRVDGTPPTLSLSLAEQPASGAQYVSGTTVYYRPGTAGGTFRVTATADDRRRGSRLSTSPRSPTSRAAAPRPQRPIARITPGARRRPTPARTTWSRRTAPVRRRAPASR